MKKNFLLVCEWDNDMSESREVIGVYTTKEDAQKALCSAIKEFKKMEILKGRNYSTEYSFVGENKEEGFSVNIFIDEWISNTLCLDNIQEVLNY